MVDPLPTHKLCHVKAAFHDTDTDILVGVSGESARMSVSMSWNAALKTPDTNRVMVCCVVFFPNVRSENIFVKNVTTRFSTYVKRVEV